MTKFFRGLLICLLGLSLVASASAQGTGSKEAVQAAVKAAVAMQKAKGKDAAFAEANKPDSSFRKGDLYLFIYAINKDGTAFAHANPKMVGTSLLEMRDADGVYINKEFIKLGDSKAASGWVKYKWPDPPIKKTGLQQGYVEQVDGVYWICGYYISNK